MLFMFLIVPATAKFSTLSLHDALPISFRRFVSAICKGDPRYRSHFATWWAKPPGHRAIAGSRKNRSEEHTSELQSRGHLVCRLLLEKKNKTIKQTKQRQSTLNYHILTQ